MYLETIKRILEMAACNPLSILLELFVRGSKRGDVDIPTLVIALALSTETKHLKKMNEENMETFHELTSTLYVKESWMQQVPCEQHSRNIRNSFLPYSVSVRISQGCRYHSSIIMRSILFNMLLLMMMIMIMLLLVVLIIIIITSSTITICVL